MLVIGNDANLDGSGAVSYCHESTPSGMQASEFSADDLTGRVSTHNPERSRPRPQRCQIGDYVASAAEMHCLCLVHLYHRHRTLGREPSRGPSHKAIQHEITDDNDSLARKPAQQATQPRWPGSSHWGEGMARTEVPLGCATSWPDKTCSTAAVT